MAISRMNMERQLRAGGGIMTLEEPRQKYFLGKLVRKAKKAVKKVAKSGGADAKADGKNLVQGGEEKGGKAPMPKEDNAGNVNTPGSKAGSKQSAAKANTADGTDGSAKKSAIGS